jgi:hypothetical protein
MSVVCPVAYFNAEALRGNGSRKKNAGRNHCDEQKFVFDHTPLIRVHASRHVGLFHHFRESPRRPVKLVI